jgi:hypothetical protein
MSYKLRYYGQFPDCLGDRIDINILQDGFLGTEEKLLLDGEPLLITYPTHNFDDPLFGCGCEINILNDSSDFFRYENLFSTPERNSYVEIIKYSTNLDSSILLFQGYVSPQLYKSTLGNKVNKLTIPAVDQLSTLDKYVPLILVDTSTYRADEYVNAFDLISNIMLDADITDTIQIHNNMVNTDYIKGDTNTVFNNIFFFSDNFSDDKGLEDDKTILSKVLKPFYSRLYYNNGKWMLERIPDIANNEKNFVQYVKEGSITKVTVDNNRINLNDHYIIKEPVLTFNPGSQKIELTLNYKEVPSLVENVYYDLQYFTKDVCANQLYPLPKFRRWMFSDVAYPEGNLIRGRAYNDTNIESGVYFLGSNLTTFKDQYVSTMFQFTPNEDGTVIGVKYKYSIPDPITTDGYSVNGRFALRAYDENGNNWWIAPDPEDPNDVSTCWSSSVYVWEIASSWEDIAKKDGVFDVAKTINITDPIVSNAIYTQKNFNININPVTTYKYFPVYYSFWYTYTTTIPAFTQYVNQLFLDVYPITRTTSYSGGDYLATATRFGDIEVNIKTDIPYNIVEASLGYFNEIVNKELDIFDVSSLSYTNGVFNLGEDYKLRRVGGWKDKSLDYYIPLQYKYIEDLSQTYANPRYNLDIDIKSKDSSLFTLGNIYTHDGLKYSNGENIEFICNGLVYNVKDNAYRLSLSEFISDDNWRIQPDPYFILDPSYFSFNYLGNITNNTVNLHSNLPMYSATKNQTWFGFTLDTSMILSIDSSLNLGNNRDGSINITPYGYASQVIYIHQDSSYYMVGTLIIDFVGGYIPQNGDSVSVSPDSGGTTYGTVASSSSTLDWRASIGASGETVCEVLSYGSAEYAGSLTLTETQIESLNNEGTVQREVTMSPV